MQAGLRKPPKIRMDARQPLRSERLPLHLDMSTLQSQGDGRSVCTHILQKAIADCAAAGGGTVLIRAGVYLTGTLWMRSNVTLHLEAGAKLLGVPDVSAFPLWVSRRRYSRPLCMITSSFASPSSASLCTLRGAFARFSAALSEGMGLRS